MVAWSVHLEAQSSSNKLSAEQGTTLEQDHFLDISTPLWSGEAILHHPTKLYAAHKSFLEAGAHVIMTAT